MSRQASPAVIGGFVIGALILVVVAILVFGSGAWLKQRVAMVTYFPGSVQGLSVGAQVQFQGVQIGQVTAIGLDYVTADNSFRIPVYYDIWPDAIGVIGEADTAFDPEPFVQGLVAERGLRAKLEPVSLVTGQYVVTLGVGTATPPTYVGAGEGPIEIPAIVATRDQIMDMLVSLPLDDLVAGITGTLAAIRSLLDSGSIQTMIGHLDQALLRFGRLADEVGRQVKPLGEQLDRTLGQYGTLGEQLGRVLGQYATLAGTLSARIDALADALESTTGDIGKLSRHLDAQVGPLAASADAALRRADKTLATLEGAVAEGSDLRYNLGLLLKEASGAARSLRDLADYLERHPEALFRGKR